MSCQHQIYANNIIEKIIFKNLINQRIFHVIRRNRNRNVNCVCNQMIQSERCFCHNVGNICMESVTDKDRKDSKKEMKRIRKEKEIFSLFSYVKQQEQNRNDEENQKQQIIFEQQVKALKEHFEANSTNESTEKDKKEVDWNEMTANEFQRYILEMLKKCIHNMSETNLSVKFMLKAEPSEPLTEHEKNFIRDKFRYLMDTTSVQFFDKITKTNVVRPDFLVLANDRKFIFDAKHYNSKSVRNKDSTLIGKQLIFGSGASSKRMVKGEVNIYEIVKLYRDIHAFKALGGGLILSPNTALTPSAQNLAVTLGLVIIKMKKRGKIEEKFAKDLQQYLIEHQNIQFSKNDE